MELQLNTVEKSEAVWSETAQKGSDQGPAYESLSASAFPERGPGEEGGLHGTTLRPTAPGGYGLRS